MSRKKLKLARIPKDSIRRATYRKRGKGLVKKAGELATLCGIDACMVVYGEGDPVPVVWPSVPAAMAVLDRFRALPEKDQYSKMMNQEDFLRQQIAKLKGQVKKLDRENRESETMLHLHNAIVGGLPGVGDLTVEQLVRLDYAVQTRLKSVQERIQILRAEQGLLAAPVMTPPVATMGSNSYAGMAGVRAPATMEELNHQGWLVEVSRGVGNLGNFAYGGYAGGDAGASTSAGPGARAVDMMQLSNLGSGFSSANLGPSFPHM